MWRLSTCIPRAHRDNIHRVAFSLGTFYPASGSWVPRVYGVRAPEAFRPRHACFNYANKPRSILLSCPRAHAHAYARGSRRPTVGSTPGTLQKGINFSD